MARSALPANYELPRRMELHWASVLRHEIQGHEQHNQHGRPRYWLVASGNASLRHGLLTAVPITGWKDGDDRRLLSTRDRAIRMRITPDMVEHGPDCLTAGRDPNGTLLFEQMRVMSVERFAAEATDLDGHMVSRCCRLRVEWHPDVELCLANVLEMADLLG